MRQSLFLYLLIGTASAFCPQLRHLAPTTMTLRPPTLLAAEARNSSEVSKENVDEYRNSVPSSRTDGGKLAEVRRRSVGLFTKDLSTGLC